MIKAHTPYVIIVISVMAAGCSQVKPGLGFDEVQKEVADRTGLQIQWDTGSPEDDSVRAEIDSMLSQELTAEQAMQIALLNSPQLRAVYEELNLAQADLVQAGLLENPIFEGALRFGTGGHGVGVDLGVAQDFISLLYIPLRKAKAAAAFEVAKLRVTGAVLDYAAQVHEVYFELQASQQFIEMRQSIVDATSASAELAERLHAAGNIRDLDLATEKALHEQAQIELAEAEAAVLIQRERLTELMGLTHETTSWRIASRLPALDEASLPDVSVLEEQATRESLELQIAQSEVEAASQAMRIARPLGLLKDAKIGIVAEREVEGELEPSHRAARDPDRGSPTWSVGPSVALGIPLFDQGQAQVATAQARLNQAIERQAAMDIRVRSQTRARYAVCKAARDRAQHIEQSLLPLRRQVVEATQLQYNAMQIGPFQLLEAKRDEIEAGAQYISALRKYWIARVRLDLIARGRLGPASTSDFDTTFPANVEEIRGPL